MSIQDLGAIGELLSSLFVLVTLVYLAVQVKQSRHLLEENRKVTLSQVYEGRANYRGALQKDMMSNPLWAEIWVKLRNGTAPQPVEVLIANFDKLTDEEKAISIFQQSAVAQGIDNSLYQIGLGLVDEDGARGSYDFIRREYALWLHSKIYIPPRITKWYGANVENGDA